MKPSIPRGTRDFGQAEMQKRLYVLNCIKRNFELFGFQPIETPAMENLTTLTNKYGEEGDQLVFKILNSRIHENKNKELLRREFELSLESSRNSEELTERALRYDLTVPFARFVTMNKNELVFPFKRYQIQPVWRADRPQKGRYREFLQCDAYVIGSDSLVNELELISLIDKTFFELNLPVVIKFNNRKILTAFAEVINEPTKIVEITIALDKLDKIGKEAVNQEMKDKGISEEAILKLQPLLNFTGSNSEKINILKNIVGDNLVGKKGIEEIQFLLGNEKTVNTKFELDITLARGLNYYTGTIFEVKTNSDTFKLSILGGGRYDDLTSVFGLSNISGVGISFGFDRIYDAMEELNLFSEIASSSTSKVLFTHFDKATQLFCLSLAAELRKNNLACEVYPDLTKKLSKQFDYANKKNIPFVCTIGSNELTSGVFAIKNMLNGEQHALKLNDMIHLIKKQLNDTND